MFAPSDSQLQAIWIAAHSSPAGKRGIFLERMIAWLQFRGGRFIDRDLDDALRLTRQNIASAALPLGPKPESPRRIGANGRHSRWCRTRAAM